MTVAKTLQNLIVDVQGPFGEDPDLQSSPIQGALPGGQPIRYDIIIQNRGESVADVDLWMEPTDRRSKALLRWGTFDPPATNLRIEPSQARQVSLNFAVPLSVEPGFYNYEIRVQAPQYPEEEVRRGQQLRVLATSENLEARNEPKITVTPPTSSEEPYVLTAGKQFTLSIAVENQSQRTDRYVLTRPADFPTTWVSVIYPEASADVAGVVSPTEGLLLNPKEAGTIQLVIHPPQYAPAGYYFPTISISSSIREELHLLEIIYLQIQANDHLSFSLEPETCKIPSAAETFTLEVFNGGNIERQLEFLAQDIDRRFHYDFDPPQLSLAPGAQASAILTPHLRHRWRQLWRLKETRSKVEVSLLNQPRVAEPEGDSALPPQEDTGPAPPVLLPALPEPQVGTLILQARRRWVLWLLLASLGVGLLATTVWLLWYWLIWRPNLRPRIVDFTPTEETYQEGEDPPIGLNWEITDPQQVRAIAILSEQQNLLKTYQLNSQGIPLPPELAQSCRIETRENESIFAPLLRWRRQQRLGEANLQVLLCKNVVPEGIETLEGNYDFQLRIYPPRETADEQTFEDAEPAPEDQVQLPADPFRSPIAPATVEGLGPQRQTPDPESAVLKDEIARHPAETEPAKASALAEELNALGTPLAVETISEVVVTPPAPPKILTLSATTREFASVSPEAVLIEEPSGPATPTGLPLSEEAVGEPTNGATESSLENTPPSDPTRTETSLEQPELSTVSPEAASPSIETNTQRPPGPIRLNWEVSNLKDIQELRLVSLAPDGTENSTPLNFVFKEADAEDQGATAENDIFSKSLIPADLSPYCFGDLALNKLVCNAVPTLATEVGEYVFYLTVIPRGEPPEEPIVKETSVIPILPPAPEIDLFAVNGQSAKSKPKHVFVVNPARGSLDIALSWQVRNATKLELLPAPGEIEGSTLNYTLSAAPGAETLTLRAVNELDEEVTRTVVIEKVEFPIRPTTPGGGDSPLPQLPNIVPVPVPPAPSQTLPPPVESPPRAN